MLWLHGQGFLQNVSQEEKLSEMLFFLDVLNYSRGFSNWDVASLQRSFSQEVALSLLSAGNFLIFRK